jgi:AraC-like DNA-binding protein
LGQPLRVEDLARRAAMSPRTFARQFRQQTGTTPHQWLTHQRLLAAQMRLEKTDDGIDAIAEKVGLQTAATLRQHFSRTLDTTPTAYRRRFSTTKGRCTGVSISRPTEFLRQALSKEPRRDSRLGCPPKRSEALLDRPP